MDEAGLIERIRELASGGPRITLGIGDDCAIFRPAAGEDLLFTSDQMIEDVHFRAAQKADSVGERALARGLSDIAAMGGKPRFCLVSLASPDDAKWIVRFFRGLTRLAKKTGTALAGGDLAHAGKIYCDVMVCGSIQSGKALRRDGARPGDIVCVSGHLGKPWDRPIEPRLALGQRLVGRASACMDLSDGLSLDLHRLCLASGVAADLESVPVAPGSPLERALHEGEDYELLFTMPPRRRPLKGTTRIGTIFRGTPGSVIFQNEPLKPMGYDHFRRS